MHSLGSCFPEAMVIIAYLIILASAALLTSIFFGQVRGNPVAPGRGLDFFFPLGHQKGRRKLFGPGGKCFHSSAFDPEVDEMLSFLEDSCCVLPVKATTVHVLSRPAQFYDELKKRVRSARRSIVMSALYIGDGPLSTQFVKCLEDKVVEAVHNGEPFDICLLLDQNRMHDRRNLLTLRQLLVCAHTSNGGSGSGLDEHDGVRVRLSLFQSPCKWNRLFAPFSRAKEVLGVQHTKIFCFDGTDTILSGANLSDDYFDTRMDRYVVIEDNPHVAEWFSDLVHTLGSLSHPVVCRKEFACRVSTRNGMSVRSPTGRHFLPQVHAKSDLVILPNATGLDPSCDSEAFCVEATKRLTEFASRASTRADSAMSTEDSYDTFLFPTIQFARAGVFHDSLVVQRLLRMAQQSTHIYLTSPYLNMYADFVDELLAGKSEYDFITASVTTNGWRGSKGFAGYIPYFYLQLERAFFYLTREYGCSNRVRVREFCMEMLTFHAKGLWFAKDSKDAQCSSDENICNGNQDKKKIGDEDEICEKNISVSTPYLVAYGSTNYGYRSVHKDVEAEVFLFTTNATLRAALREELVLLLRQSTPVTEERFVRGAQGRFQPVVSLIAQMGQSFL